MTCILQPECNFLHRFFRCHLPVEMVDVEVRITSIQGTHTFRRDRMCQIINCNPWCTRLCPQPTIIKKIKTYLELEGKLGPKLQPQTDQSSPAQPDTNPHMRKETKVIEKRKLIPTKNYKVKVVARPKSKTSNETAQPPITTPNAPTNLESKKPSQGGTSENNSPPLKHIPTCVDTPWPKAGRMSGNLFKLRKDWPIPPTIYYIKPIKIEPQTQEQASPVQQQHQKQRSVNVDQIAPSVKTWKKTGMVNTKSNFSRMFQVHCHNNPRCKAFNALRPRIIRCPKTFSTPSCRHLMFLIDTQTN